MNFKNLIKKMLHNSIQRIRILKYILLSNMDIVKGHATLKQPVLFSGTGIIHIGKHVSFGYFPSPFFYNGYIYIDARNRNSKIIIGDQT